MVAFFLASLLTSQWGSVCFWGWNLSHVRLLFSLKKKKPVNVEAQFHSHIGLVKWQICTLVPKTLVIRVQETKHFGRSLWPAPRVLPADCCTKENPLAFVQTQSWGDILPVFVFLLILSYIVIHCWAGPRIFHLLCSFYKPFYLGSY